MVKYQNMARKKTVAKKSPKTDDLFHICMEYGRDELVGKGATIYEAFADLDKPKKVYKSCVVVIRHGDRKVARVISMTVLKRIFGHSPTQSSWLKLFEKL